MSNGANVKVVARFRPAKDPTQPTVVRTNGKSVTMGEKHDFTFDRVFDTNATQEQVYAETTQQVVVDLLNGVNCTVMAYGQTGSGKSYTMMGNLARPADQGITPRILIELFLAIPDLAKTRVECSYVEVYMEKVRDLLHPENDNLRLRETAGSVYVEKCTIHSVHSAEELMGIMVKGEKNRSVAATEMNAHSSRSHSIFIVTIAQPTKSAKLVLVDLAGSEQVDRSGVSGHSLDEAKQINKSLSALAMVIQSLTEQKKQHHVPYRNSKLTRLLTESLGGNSKTVIILAAAPEAHSLNETLCTLKFGSRAKRMKNSASANELPVDPRAEQLARLEDEVNNWKLQASEWKEKFESLQQRLTVVNSLEYVEPVNWRSDSTVSSSVLEASLREINESVISGAETLIEDISEPIMPELVLFRTANVVVFNSDQLFLFENILN